MPIPNFGMWIPFITKTKLHFEPQGKANIIGLIIAIVNWIMTKDFNVAIAASGLFAGGMWNYPPSRTYHD